MGKFIVAFATDDGENFVDRHFGDAKYYDLYEIDGEKKAVFLKRIENKTEIENEKPHGDPRKARGVFQTLAPFGVNVLVGRAFGPNINRMKSKFLCVIVGDEKIADGINRTLSNLDKIESEYEKGESREYLVLRKKN